MDRDVCNKYGLTYTTLFRFSLTIQTASYHHGSFFFVVRYNSYLSIYAKFRSFNFLLLLFRSACISMQDHVTPYHMNA